MPKRPPRPPVLHPIQVVTRRTGVSADVLRVWEKRYAVVTPVRSTGGRRLYSDADIERLRLLVHATRTGRTIGQIAALPTTALFDACLDAVARFDAVKLDLLLRRAVVVLSADELLTAVVGPLREQLHVRLLDGSVRRAHGLLAHAVLRRVLDHVVATATAPLDSRDLVVTTLGSHAQEVDALVVAAAAAAEGWRVTFIGSRVPTDDVVDTLEHLEARLLVLSLAAPPGDREVPRELRRLRALLPAPIEVLVVGATPDVHRSSVVDTGATPLGGLTELRAHLRERHAAARAVRAAEPAHDER
jgi:DNA-binding transcriptional MerR regulator/methylmalonyl-CoA mutase cobalamin-binding subunit